MSYQNYEDYMRNVLGYSPYVGQNDYTYQEPEDMYNYQDTQEEVSNIQDVTPFYPEIYKLVYPMVCKVCNIHIHQELTKELLEQMVDEIYRNVEPENDNNSNQQTRAPLKNGDVRNPNSKDPEPVIKETRQINFLLRDLIRILLLREWGRPTRPPFRPPMGPGGRPPMGPGMPPSPPPRPGMGGRPPIPPQRPRYY